MSPDACQIAFLKLFAILTEAGSPPEETNNWAATIFSSTGRCAARLEAKCTAFWRDIANFWAMQRFKASFTGLALTLVFFRQKIPMTLSMEKFTSCGNLISSYLFLMVTRSAAQGSVSRHLYGASNP
jgi:hypothetical protein